MLALTRGAFIINLEAWKEDRYLFISRSVDFKCALYDNPSQLQKLEHFLNKLARSAHVRMESVGLVKVTWKGTNYELPAPSSSGRTLHAEVASQFGIPLSRLKLLLKGRTYASSESMELVQEATTSGSRIMVLGTAAGDHLDSMQNRARYGSAAATDVIM